MWVYVNPFRPRCSCANTFSVSFGSVRFLCWFMQNYQRRDLLIRKYWAAFLPGLVISSINNLGHLRSVAYATQKTQ
jgi:predicted signal transduction protein with EAL and GGDEF domain